VLFRSVSETGPEHEKIFEVEVSINGELFARSTGRSKKEAEQAAAHKTLEMLDARALPASP
jgi:ribonuclease-3